jgi:hypothetical protein
MDSRDSKGGGVLPWRGGAGAGPPTCVCGASAHAIPMLMCMYELCRRVCALACMHPAAAEADMLPSIADLPALVPLARPVALLPAAAASAQYSVRCVDMCAVPLASRGVTLSARVWAPMDTEGAMVLGSAVAGVVLEYLPYRLADWTSRRDELRHGEGLLHLCILQWAGLG